MRVSLGKRGLLLAATATFVVAVGAGVAYATGAISTGSSQTILGCVKNQNGQLRIVGDASQCLSSEHALSFAAPAAPPGPVSVTVDCGAGGNLQHAIDTADVTQPLTVTIKGTCVASVSVLRDNVTLQAGSAGSGITSDGTGPALQVGARDVSLQGLTLTGGIPATLLASSGASIQANDDHIVGDVAAGDNANAYLVNVTVDHCQGVSAKGGATVFISGGSITGCGVATALGGSMFLRDGVRVTNAQHAGVSASNGGSIVIDGATISNAGIWGVVADGGSVRVSGNTTVVSGSGFAGVVAANGGTAVVMNGAQISGNPVGVFAQAGGHLQIASDGGGGAIIERNSRDGVRLVGASSLLIGGQAVVRDNGGDGISVSDTSVAVFDDATVTGNAGRGVHCDGPPSVAVIRGSTTGVTGNAAGNVDCQNAGQPG
jgi:hypothetical protein